MLSILLAIKSILLTVKELFVKDSLVMIVQLGLIQNVIHNINRLCVENGFMKTNLKDFVAQSRNTVMERDSLLIIRNTRQIAMDFMEILVKMIHNVVQL